MEDRTRKALYFFVGIIVPIILIGIGVAPGFGNILLVIFGIIWFGFALLLISPPKD